MLRRTERYGHLWMRSRCSAWPASFPRGALIAHPVGVDVTLPDGTRIRASSLAEREERDPERSFGLYIDERWQPTWPAAIISWADFGLPVDSKEAASQIEACGCRKIPFRLQISQFGLSDQNFGTPHAKRVLASGRCAGLKGKTPEATITAMLAVGSKPGGPFARVDKGTYTLADAPSAATQPAQPSKPAATKAPTQTREPAQAQKPKRAAPKRQTAKRSR
jgi:hypothetical protein